MKAIIFNSGLGKRMGEFTQNHHKSMAVLKNGETVFARQIRILSECGIREFIVTTGPFHEQLEETAAKFPELTFHFVRNPIYDKTNYIYSMYLARELFDDDVLMLHGDLVFNKKLVEKIIACPEENTGCVNQKLPQPEKDFKARIVGNQIREVSVKIFDGNCYAFQPLYKLSKAALAAWTRRVEQFIENGVDGVYAENALNELLGDEVKIHAFSYEDDYVDEIDNLDDHARVTAAIRLFDFAEQEIVSGKDSFLSIPTLLEKCGAKKPMLVCDRSSFDFLFLKDYLDSLSWDFVRFDGFSPNPKYDEVKEGVELFRRENCDAILSIGGGSAIDTAKNIKMFAVLNPDEVYLKQELQYSPIPHIAIPTTAGTGSESTHFSVVYYNGEKQSVAQDCMLPDAVVLEPRLLETLPVYQKKSTLLDAMCQCIEAIWSVNTSDACRAYAKTGLRLILDNLFGYFRGESEANEQIMLGANYGGRAINLSQTTAAHAMSYKLTSLYGISHGHAVSLCLPHVWRYVLSHQSLLQEGLSPAHLRSALNIFRQVFKVKSDAAALKQFEFVLNFFEMEVPELRSQEELEILTASVNPQRLKNNPVFLSTEAIRELYEVILGVRPPDGSDETTRQRMEKQKELRELQGEMLEILKDFDEFCTKNRLKYYLGEGSLLGAIRHHGFIPWDDDVDVLMPREDYDRFIRMSTGRFYPNRYHVDCFETNKKHWVLGAKIQKLAPSKFYQENTKGLAHYPGPYIDVFPLDYVPERNSVAQQRRIFKMRGLRRVLWLKTGFSDKMAGRLRKGVMKLIAALMPMSFVRRSIDRTMRHDNDKRKSFHINYCSYYDLSKQIFPRGFYGAGVRVPFEGCSLVVPKQADYILRTVYGGSYMDIPNANKQRVHNFEVNRDFKPQPKAEPAPRQHTSPRLSFIVPVYNVEKLLPRCLDSLVQQTFEDIEILVVNDGSPDNSQAIIDEYAAKYPGLVIPFTKPNGGLSDARNYALPHAKGEYVAFIDSDDYVSVDMARLMMAKADETDADVVVCGINRVETEKNRITMAKNNYDGCFGVSVLEDPKVLLAAKPYAHSKIFRKKLFMDSGIRYPVGQCFEDSATTYNLLLLANRIEYVPQGLYFYIVDRSDSITNVVDNKIYDIFKSAESIYSFYKEHGAYEACQDIISEIIRMVIFARLTQLPKITNREFAAKYIKEAYRNLEHYCPGWRKNPYYWLSSRKKIQGHHRLTRRYRASRIGFYWFYRYKTRQLQKKVLSTGQSSFRHLEALQEIQFGILKTFDHFCREHNLTYYMAEGTLLGVIRHGGFIPWDDDIDVLMPREDYERFIELYGDQLYEDCLMLNQKVFDRYYLTFTKLVTTKKTGYWNRQDKFPDKFSGPCIDIFPLDHGVARESKSRMRTIRFYRDILMYKAGAMTKPSRRRKLIRVLPRYFTPFYSFEALHKKIRDLYTVYNGEETGYRTNFASSYVATKETFPKEAFDTVREISFEGYPVYIPGNADAVLSKIYGDYLKLPPASKRTPKHSLVYDPETVEQ